MYAQCNNSGTFTLVLPPDLHFVNVTATRTISSDLKQNTMHNHQKDHLFGLYMSCYDNFYLKHFST
jgi:hypothetical protein